MILAAALWLAAAASAADPTAAKLQAAARSGLRLLESRGETLDGRAVTAALFSDERRGGGQLDIYLAEKGKAYLIYTHPSSGESLRLDPAGGRGFARPFGKGGPGLLYHGENRALGRRMLYALRYEKPRFRRVAAVRDGQARDLDGDGSLELIGRTAPLGSFFTVSCPGFETMAQAAAAREVLAWDGASFVAASERFPAYFERALAEDEADAAALAPAKDERPGEYLAKALTVYFDYAALGKRREGWSRFCEMLRPNRELPGVAQCLRKIKDDLRAALSIPADWE